MSGFVYPLESFKKALTVGSVFSIDIMQFGKLYYPYKDDPKNFFKTIYKILLGRESGPRLGPYILESGKETIIRKLEDSL